MSARLPLLHKTPFVLDPRPLQEATSPHAGLLGISRVFRSLGLPNLIAANLPLRKRQRGFTEAQLIESMVLLQAVGGECPEDMHLISKDAWLEEGRGYQPMVAVWAEADLVVADEFRDGNVPAKQAPLTCAKLAFAALPETITQRYFRGDSACHENELLGWLKHPDRGQEPGGRIGFAVSAVMSQPLAKALREVKEADWKKFGIEDDGTLRQWAEVDFVPGDEYERKDSQPLRACFKIQKRA